MNGPPCWSLSWGSGWEAAQRVSLLLTARPQPAGGRGRSPRTVAPPTPTLSVTHLDAVSAVQQLKCGLTFEKKMTLIDCWRSCCVQRGLAPPTPWPSVRAWRTGQQPRTSPTSLTLTKRRTNWHRWCGYFLASCRVSRHAKCIWNGFIFYGFIFKQCTKCSSTKKSAKIHFW